MTLSEFIEREVDRIVDEWAEFAQTRLPAARELSARALRNDARELLLHIADEMEGEQSGEEQRLTARGQRPDHAPQITATAQQHALSRFNEGFSVNELVAEYRALRASVVRRWTEHMLHVDRDALHDLVRFGAALDQALTESLAWYAGRVEQARSLLLGTLGHDLRNPLGAVRNSAAYLLRSSGLTGAQTKAVARILSSTDRMQRMVEDLLDFTRTRLGTRLPIAPAEADLAEICRQTIDELQAFHPDSALRLECAGELAGHWDAPRIAQLLSNLVANAIQHGPAGATVTVTASGGPRDVTLQVHNPGAPIAPGVRRTLFEPAMRAAADATARREGASGLGLGLYIARQIALAHGGSIEVASSEPDGTTFTVRLPARPEASAAGGQGAPPPPSPPSPSPSPSSPPAPPAPSSASSLSLPPSSPSPPREG